MKAETPETAFFWPARRKSSWRLAGLIFAMLFAHSAAFFLFQAATPEIYPPPRTAPPIQMLTPYGPDGLISAENESLLRWIEAEDPSLVARVPNVDLPPLMEVPFRPSFTEMRTPPLGIPPEPATVQFPPARDAMALIRSGMPQRPLTRETLPPRVTELQFSTPLARRVMAAPKFKPQHRTAQLVQTSLFLLGVTAEGETRFVFPQKQESGSIPALEKEATGYLASLRFQPDPAAPIVWASVNVRWGDDIVAEP